MKISIGMQFGRLTVISEFRKTTPSKTALYYKCACSCGNTKDVRGDHLRTGKILSCRCLRVEINTVRLTTHGKRDSRIYRIWRDMINRCHYEKYHERHLYGGRGIIVCDRWRLSFESFLSDMGEPKNNLSIDRIDSNGNYEPSNCKWSTSKEQAANRRKPMKRCTQQGVEFREFPSTVDA